MSVAMDGTRVLFAEVPLETWRSAGTVPFVREPRYQSNITYSQGNRGLDLSRTGTAVLAVPPPAVSGRPCNSTPATESGESFAHPITDPQAAEPVTLHARRFLESQQGVGHVFVGLEDGEVVSPRHRGSVRP